MSIASVVRHPIDQLLMISACGSIILRNVQCDVLLEGLEVGSEVLWVLAPGVEGWSVIDLGRLVSILTDLPVGETNLERQSAALFFAPEIHSKVIL